MSKVKEIGGPSKEWKRTSSRWAFLGERRQSITTEKQTIAEVGKLIINAEKGGDDQQIR